MQLRYVLLAVVVLAVAAPVAFAGDIIAMPTGNMVPAGKVQLHYIYWDREPIATPDGPVRDYLHIGEVHYGVTDRLELDFLYVAPQGLEEVSEFNAYYALIPESAAHPSLIVGATNLGGQDWLPSSERPAGDNRTSYFAVSSYNIWQPAGPPSLNDPLLRLHVGWGNNWHEDQFFGGLQMQLLPCLGLGVFNYQEKPAYLAAWMPWPNLELNAGWDQGDPVYHVGWTHDF